MGALFVCNSAAREHLREAPIRDLHLAERADENVGGLQVSVYDAARVGVGHGVANLLEDAQEADAILGGLHAIFEQARERAAPDQLHCEVRPLLGIDTQLVDRHDARMLELSTDLGFLDEALDEFRVPGVIVA